MTGAAAPASPPAKLRRGRITDVDALAALEQAVFTADRLSRRSLRHFVTAPNATLIVAGQGGKLAGYALVRYPPCSTLARLYSIAVAPHIGRRGIGSLLLTDAESEAWRHGRSTMRIEVHEQNTRALAFYEKWGYRRFGRHADYYADHGGALRFSKALTRPSAERLSTA